LSLRIKWSGMSFTGGNKKRPPNAQEKRSWFQKERRAYKNPNGTLDGVKV
jgi:hypothetical protein